MSTDHGCYVYGLIRSGEDRDYGCIGLDYDGGPGRVRTVRVGSVAAVVSEYQANAKVMPLRKNLDPHHRVIREIMKSSTIIPMTFGHVARSEDEVALTLKRNRDDIRAELDRVDGKVEMNLKVFWDVDNIFEYFVEIDDELAAFRDQLFGRSHAPSQSEMIELGQKFEQLLEKEREELAERVVEGFRPCFSEVTVNPPKSEKCVMDLAFLVARERMKDFEETVNQVAGSFPAQYLFDYGGPWAPFNFTELDLRSAAS
jgi:Gas vesicle synthesis protein GvpL/GvpF